MPRNREYQFAAMAVVQTFVNGYESRCKANDVSQGTVTYGLRYELDMAKTDYAFFERCGLVLNKQPERLENVDMQIDLREARMDGLRDGRKHLVQAGGAMCGVQARPLPVLRTRALRTGDWRWIENPSLDELISIEENEVTGIVAQCGPETYLAASLGLAVVELRRSNDDPAWLSKWQNQLYRSVVTDEPDARTEELIARAKRSVQDVVMRIIERQAA